MRRSLEGYSEVLRDEAKLKASMKEKERAGEYESEEQEVDRGELNKLAVVVDYRMTKAMERSHTEKEVQEKVVDIQRRKQELMLELRQQLREIDNPEREWKPREGERPVEYRDGEYIWKQEVEDGTIETRLTLGDIITDMAWGLSYSLDPATVPRRAHKMMAVERTKGELMDLLNRQIAEEEGARMDKTEERRQMFRMISGELLAGREKLMSPEMQKMHEGHVAEVMVENFFKKLQLDLGVEINVQMGDLMQDMVQKIDFVVSRSRHRRGVGVETTDTKNLGVQFTLRADAHAIGKKQSQIKRAKKKLVEKDRIDDIVLVSVPIVGITKQYKAWFKAGRPPGGPEQYWPEEVKEYVFKGVLDGVFEQEELDRMWAELPEEGKGSLEISLGALKKRREKKNGAGRARQKVEAKKNTSKEVRSSFNKGYFRRINKENLEDVYRKFRGRRIVAPVLYDQLRQAGEVVGKDILGDFAARVERDQVRKPKEMFKVLSEVLEENKVEPISLTDDSGLSEALLAYLSKRKDRTGQDRADYITELLFPGRRTFETILNPEVVDSELGGQGLNILEVKMEPKTSSEHSEQSKERREVVGDILVTGKHRMDQRLVQMLNRVGQEVGGDLLGNVLRRLGQENKKKVRLGDVLDIVSSELEYVGWSSISDSVDSRMYPELEFLSKKREAAEKKGKTLPRSWNAHFVFNVVPKDTKKAA